MTSKAKLLPLGLILLTVLSIYLMRDNQRTDSDTYAAALASAREDRENGVPIKAEEKYKDLINTDPSLDLYLEVGDFYKENDMPDDAEQWFSKMESAYPNEPEVYLYGLQTYLDEGAYTDAFQTYDTYKNRSSQSDEVEELMKPYWYQYYLRGSFEDVSGIANDTGISAVSNGGYWAYISRLGSEFTGYRFKEAGVFNGGSAPVVDMNGDAYFINSSAQKVFTPPYIEKANEDAGRITKFRQMTDDYIVAFNGKTWDVYDAGNYKKLFGGYKDISCFSNGIAAATKDGEKWGLVSSSGDELTKFEYDEILADTKNMVCRSDALIVKKDGKCSLISRDGKAVSDASYDDARAFYDDTYAAVRKGDKWIFVDGSGAEKEPEEDYTDALSFSDGYACVKKGGRWGAVDTDGNLVIDYTFKDIRPFSALGTAFVKQEDDSAWQLLILYNQNHS